MSILVDFYNLDLDTKNLSVFDWHTPEADREKILDFFEKHAKEVLRYQTAEEIEALKKSVNPPVMVGTLGHFELRRKQSWFDSNAINFYADYNRIHQLSDLYLEGKEIPKYIIAWIHSLAIKR